MAASAGIYQQFLNPVRSVADYRGDMDKQEQNALTLAAGRLTNQQAQQSMADDQAARQATIQGAGDSGATLNALQKAGLFKQAQAYQKSMFDNQEAQGKVSKQKVDLIDARLKQSRNYLEMVKTPEQYLQWHEGNHSDPILGPELAARGVTAEQARASITEALSKPGGFEELLNKSRLGIEKFAEMNKPTVHVQNLGGTSQVVSTPGMGGAPTVLSNTPITQSEDNKATNTRAAADALAGRQQSDRHADASRETQLLVAGLNPDGRPSADVESNAKAIAAGKLAPINGFALARPRGQAIMARVMEINPAYDAGDYAAKNAALKGFSTGKEGTALRSFNVATDHLKTLGDMATALNNGNNQFFNQAANYYAEKTGSPAPTNFDAVKEIVGKEVVKAIVAGGGGVAEREELSNLLGRAKSPQQLNGVIGHFTELMGAQRDGLLDQYERTTGRTDGAVVFAPSKRTPKAAPAAAPTVPGDISALLQKHGGKP